MKRSSNVVDSLDNEIAGPSTFTQQNDEEMSMEAVDERQTVDPYEQAYLHRLDALDQLVDEKCNELAPDWKTEDLAALFARTRNSSCTEEGVRTFINVFANTSVEDVMLLLNQMKDVIFEAENTRFRLDQFNPTQSCRDLESSSSAALQKARFDHRTSEQQTKMSNGKFGTIERSTQEFCFGESNTKRSQFTFSINFILWFQHRASDDVFSPACQEDQSISYANLYNYLAEAAIIRKPKVKLQPLESAVLWNIFEEMYEIADQNFDKHTAYFRQLLHDFQSMSHSDLSFLGLPPEDELGKAMWNTLALPDKVIDLSAYLGSQPTESTSTTETTKPSG
ncbi:hypothetical protein M3Y98_00041800 [Aphelenchoides besseyi]|nr:hypothetical protein M3Y98_00041800 [Aphelenchoides besseyi]